MCACAEITTGLDTTDDAGRERPVQKAKMEIILIKTPQFDALMEASTGQQQQGGNSDSPDPPAGSPPDASSAPPSSSQASSSDACLTSAARASDTSSALTAHLPVGHACGKLTLLCSPHAYDWAHARLKMGLCS